MKISANSPDEYFEAIPEDRSEQLGILRKMVKRSWPKVKEDLSNGMPTYHLDGHPFMAMASQKNFMAVYIMPYDLLDAFNKDLKAYDHGKSCIRFRSLDDDKLELFDRIIKYTGSQHTDSKFFGKTNGKLK